MGKYLWNKLTGCRVPETPGLNVERNKNLEWRNDDDLKVAVEEAIEVKAQVDARPALEPPKVKAGDDDAIRKTTIIAAIKALKPEDFTSNGSPNAKVLSDLCGFPVSASERDDLWSGLQK